MSITINHQTGEVSVTDGPITVSGSSGVAVVAPMSLTGAAESWQFSLSGNNLIISYGTSALAKLDTSGNLTVIGDVTAFGIV